MEENEIKHMQKNVQFSVYILLIMCYNVFINISNDALRIFLNIYKFQKKN